MGDCVEWTKYRNACGYGVQGLPGRAKRTFLAHRVAYAAANGIDVDDIGALCVLHTCDNPACINPEHLWLGTPMDNAMDMVAKGRNAKNIGETNPRARLTAPEVLEIRKQHALGSSNQELGVRFGVTHQNINRIVKRLNWRHV